MEMLFSHLLSLFRNRFHIHADPDTLTTGWMAECGEMRRSEKGIQIQQVGSCLITDQLLTYPVALPLSAAAAVECVWDKDLSVESRDV